LAPPMLRAAAILRLVSRREVVQKYSIQLEIRFLILHHCEWLEDGMANTTSVIPRLDDKTVLEIFRELQEACKPNGMSLQATGIDSVDLLSPDESAKSVLLRLAVPNSHLITFVSLNYPNFNVNYVRNQDPNRLSPFYDEIRIDHNQNSGGLD